MSLLLDLSLRGTLVAGVIWLLNRAGEGTLAARDRRAWWVLVPLAFLMAIPVPVLSVSTSLGRHTSG